MLVALSIVIAIAAGIAGYRIAAHKGRNAWAWMVASLLFIVPAVVVAALPPIDPNRR